MSLRHCTHNKLCKCYKCVLSNAIKVNAITDEFPGDLIEIIVNYLGKYVIYGLSNTTNTYQIIPQLTPLIDEAEDIHYFNNYLLIQTQLCELYLIDVSTDHNQIIKLSINSKSIFSFIPNSIKNMFRKTTSDINTQKQQNGKWILPITGYNFVYFGMNIIRIPIINSTSFAMHEIEIDRESNNIKIHRMQKMEKQLKKFNIQKNDKIKKFMYFGITRTGFGYLERTTRSVLLFESGKSIEISRITNQSPYSWSKPWCKQHDIKAKDIHQYRYGDDFHTQNYNRLYVTDSEDNLWHLVQHKVCLKDNTELRKVVMREYDYMNAYTKCHCMANFAGWNNSDKFWRKFFQEFDGYEDVQIVYTAVGYVHIICV